MTDQEAVCSVDRRKRWEVTGDRSSGGCTNRTLTCATRGWWKANRGGRIPCCWWRCWRQSGFWWGVHSQSCSNTDLHPLSSAMPVGRHTLHWHMHSGSTGQVKTCYLHWYGYWSCDDTHYTGTCTLAVLVRWRHAICIGMATGVAMTHITMAHTLWQYGQVKTCYLHWYGCWSSDDTHYTGTCTLAVLVRWRQLTCIDALVWLQEQWWFTLHWHVYSSGISQVQACYLHVHWYGYWSSTSRDDTHYTGTCTLAVLMRWRCTTCIVIGMDTGVVITHTTLACVL